MKIIKVRISDSLDSVYRLLKKMGIKGRMSLSAVQDKMYDYVFDQKKNKINPKKAQQLQDTLGRFGIIYRNGIYTNLDKDELKKMFTALNSVMPDKVYVNFTLGLNEVKIK